MGFGGFVVLTYLFSLEEAGAETLGGMGTCPSPPVMARVRAGTGRSQLLVPAWALQGWLLWGTGQVTTAKVFEAARNALLMLRHMGAFSDCSGMLSSSAWRRVVAPSLVLHVLAPSLLQRSRLSKVWAVLSARGRNRMVLQRMPAPSCRACPPSPNHLQHLLSTF